jgi:hypothetical protein
MAPILRSAPLGGESERVFFAFVTLVRRKHTNQQQFKWSSNRSKAHTPYSHLVSVQELTPVEEAR